MLAWCNQSGICCFLSNNQYPSAHHSFECLAGAGAAHYFEGSGSGTLERLQAFIDQHPASWKMGHIAYDLKNDIEPLQSAKPDFTGFADCFFFVPETVLLLSVQELKISCPPALDPAEIFDAIVNTAVGEDPVSVDKIGISARFSKEEYTDTVTALRKRLLRGDCYEINFCQEFYAGNAIVNPLSVYRALEKVSPVPFGAFYKVNDKYLCCASPERYLRREGDIIISQPVKGTARRDMDDAAADAAQRQQLRQSAKERSENVMVVDLVRNDLSRVCIPGSVTVTELFGVYSFPQVHQLISTVEGRLVSGTLFRDIIRASFPMGSMTGAPKKRVMELIEQYEKTSRGIYSGTIGYIAPGGDFDFNVVIRSIVYNAARRYLSYQVGSAITFYSNPEAEYEECLLKAMAIKSVLE